MRIDRLYEPGKPVISFEIFPPKTYVTTDALYNTLEQLSILKPGFISVTCGAGGSGGDKTVELASLVKNKYNVETLVHMTCISSSVDDVERIAGEMESARLENVLALRGDIPLGQIADGNRNYVYAKDLISDISKKGFCAAAAAYPEGHIDCDSFSDNIEYTKQKEEAGASVFVTQLFFENEYFLKFVDSARKAGVKSPITAGIMPMMSRTQIERMIFMCGTSLPSRIIKLLNKYADNRGDLFRAGLEYAREQIDRLIDCGIDGIHIYTMNRPEVAEYLSKGLL